MELCKKYDSGEGVQYVFKELYRFRFPSKINNKIGYDTINLFYYLNLTVLRE